VPSCSTRKITEVSSGADDGVEQAAVRHRPFARRTEQHDAAVVVGTGGQGQVENELGTLQNAEARVPLVAIDAVGDRAAEVGTGGLGVVEEDLLRALAVDRDAEQAALAVVVHVHVQHETRLQHTAEHATDLPVGLLQHEEVVGRQERHRCRLRETARYDRRHDE
jgi:hypothetical protein